MLRACAALLLLLLPGPVAAVRCSPKGPAYDIERFKQAPPGWRLAGSYDMPSEHVFAPCPTLATRSLDWCCKYVSDWGPGPYRTPPGPESLRPGPGGACLQTKDVVAAACLAAEGCWAFSGETLYIRPAPSVPGGTWTDNPSPPHWQRCTPYGGACPPVYVLVDLGPKPYGRGDCTRAFDVALTHGNVSLERPSYARWPNHFRRQPVLRGACTQFEGYIGGKLAYMVLRNLISVPTDRYTWDTFDKCQRCTRQPPPNPKAQCSLC